MKSRPFFRNSSLAKVPALLAACALWPWSTCPAAEVDTELVLLVDAQTYSQSDFNLILDSAARTFEQQSFQDAVLNGATGKMAASVLLFNAAGERVGIPWMELSSRSDLQTFAQSVRGITNPNLGGNVNYASAITSAANQLDWNFFTGTVRQITMIDDATGFWAADPSGTQAARNAALATSADIINAIVFDAQYSESTVNGFYNANVVSPGGTLSVVSTPQGGPKTTGQIEGIVTAVTVSVAAPTLEATTMFAASAVPEPSSAALLVLGSLLLFRRRR